MSTQYFDDSFNVTKNEPVISPWTGTRVRGFAKGERRSTRNMVSILDEVLNTFEATKEMCTLRRMSMDVKKSCMVSKVRNSLKA